MFEFTPAVAELVFAFMFATRDEDAFNIWVLVLVFIPAVWVLVFALITDARDEEAVAIPLFVFEFTLLAMLAV